MIDVCIMGTLVTTILACVWILVTWAREAWAESDVVIIPATIEPDVVARVDAGELVLRVKVTAEPSMVIDEAPSGLRFPISSPTGVQ